MGPWEKRQTEIDGGRVQRVQTALQIHALGIVGMQRSRNFNQYLGKPRVDSPIAGLVGISECGGATLPRNPMWYNLPRSNEGRLRYLADCRDKLAARKPSTDTGPSKRKSFADNRRDNESHIFETHRRAGGPGVGRKPFGRSSFIILTPRPSPSSRPFRPV